MSTCYDSSKWKTSSKKNNRTVLRNVHIVNEKEISPLCDVVIEGKKIISCGEYNEFNNDCTVIDFHENYLSAGFIDLHIHGGNNYDFMDGTTKAFEEIACYHSKHGVTSMLATTLAGREEEIFQLIENYKKTASKIECCNILGIHLEGPYFSQEQRGAQDPKYITLPNPEQYIKFIATGSIRRISAAPELYGALDLAECCKNNGIIASIAHTNADFETVEEAIKHGYDVATHLYSGMSGVHRKGAFRVGGVIEAGLYFDEITAEIIADGCHLPASLIKFIYKCKGKDRIILTSDAMRGAGMPEGTIVKLGSLEAGQDVVIEEGVAKLMDRASFAGSIASADRLIRTMTKKANVPLCEAIQMMTINPAKLLGIDRYKGSVEPGKDADLVVFDSDINVLATVVNGRIVYNINSNM